MWCDVYLVDDVTCFESPAGGQTRNLPSLAYQFYLHLRAGHMVPIQDAEALKVKTSQDLKAAPIELHILPLCDA